MITRVIHVAGTGTGVGKTTVACAVAAACWRAGMDVGVCKPFASGQDPASVPGDARLLLAASGAADALELVSPVRYRTPASPWAAARDEGAPPDSRAADRAIEELCGRHSALVVEGIGGVAVPLDDGRLYADFMSEHQGRVLVVALAGLGTVNHTLLTLEALRTRGVRAAGVVLNRPSPGTDPSEKLNPAAIERFGSVAVLADLPHRPGREPDLGPALLAALGLRS